MVQKLELVNRPAIGLSMCVGSLAALRTNLHEAAGEGIFDKTFVQKFEALCVKFDLTALNHTLNLQDALAQ